jgi:hypothetical protein
MAIEVLFLMLAASAPSSVETWLESLPACHHQISKHEVHEENRPPVSEIIAALENNELKAMQALRAIEQLSSQHVNDSEAKTVVAALRRLAESPKTINVRFDFGGEVEAKDAADYEVWFARRLQKAAADTLFTHPRALTSGVLSKWAKGKNEVLALSAEHALTRGARK